MNTAAEQILSDYLHILCGEVIPVFQDNDDAFLVTPPPEFYGRICGTNGKMVHSLSHAMIGVTRNPHARVILESTGERTRGPATAPDIDWKRQPLIEFAEDLCAELGFKSRVLVPKKGGCETWSLDNIPHAWHEILKLLISAGARSLGGHVHVNFTNTP